jgi:flagellin
MKRKRSFKYIWEWTPSKIQGGKEMRINHNISAMNTYRQYNTNATFISKSMEKLSSGYRINRAADDAAGLSISEKMRSQIRGLKQAIRNAQDGISFLQTAEGALTEVSDMLTRLKELAVQVQNGTYSDEDKANIGAEMNALGKAITDIYVNTKFNGIKVFGEQEDISANSLKNEITAYTEEHNNVQLKYNDGKWQLTDGADIHDLDAYGTIEAEGLDTTKAYKVTVTDDTLAIEEDTATNPATVDLSTLKVENDGALKTQDGSAEAAKIFYGEDAKQRVTVMQANTTNISALTSLCIAAGKGADDAVKVTVDAVEAAISEVNTVRAGYGAQQNQLEHASNNMATTRENLQAAESRVRDVDMAEEMMEYTKNNILLQAAQAMLAQANSQPQGVLQLLQ